MSQGMTKPRIHIFEIFFELLQKLVVGVTSKKTVFPSSYKSRERFFPKLKKDENNVVVCTSCGLCASFCPTSCIRIEAGMGSDSVKRTPVVLEVNIDRCINCSYCHSICPIDAIEAQTSVTDSLVATGSVANLLID